MVAHSNSVPELVVSKALERNSIPRGKVVIMTEYHWETKILLEPSGGHEPISCQLALCSACHCLHL